MTEVQLTDAQQFIVNFVFDHWFANNEWPTKSLIKAALIDNGHKHGDIESEELWNYGSSISENRYCLKLPGFNSAKNSETVMRYFVGFVRKCVNLYLDSLGDEVYVKSTDLHDIAIDWSDREFVRYSSLYLDWTRTIGNHQDDLGNGLWRKQLDIRCVSYRDLKSVDDYISRSEYKADHADGRPSPEQKKMAMWAIEQWRLSGKSPYARDVIHAHLDQFEDPLSLWKSLPYYIFHNYNRYWDYSSALKVTIEALGVLRPETDDELQVLWRMTQAVRDVYKKDPGKERLTFTEIANIANIAERDAERLASISGTAIGIGFNVNGYEGERYLVPEDKLFELVGKNTLEEFLMHVEANLAKVLDNRKRGSIFGFEYDSDEDPFNEKNYGVDGQFVDAETRSRLKRNKLNTKSRKVFVVHGHDDGAKQNVARLLERLELEPVILDEKPNKGQTIIEKFESVVKDGVSFAVVLITPDDLGVAKSALSSWPLDSEASKTTAVESLKERARQNVVLELGYFISRLGRENVCVLKKGNIDFPTDYSGVIWIPMDDSGWQSGLAKELRASGLELDMNKL